ncbi:MAG: S8 family serine peptidase, partial [Caldilineaceae bacterium]|nr:S8 family serine peptidase [Caldilineaceae bacterium]
GEIMDDYGHGTHGAGTIGAIGNNSTGVVGVNWNVRIVACKFLSASGGGTTANAVKCFQYVNKLKEQGVNVVATNNSWGGGSASQALYEAMAGPPSIIHVCAAGNSNTDRIQYPAAYDLDNIISVAATDHEDLYASFSNYGADWVDLAAPGVDTYSTVPDGNCAMCDSSGYNLASGTSMATPHVTGAVALVFSKYKELSNEQVKQRLLSGADQLPEQSKKTLTNGRLNLLNAMEDDQTPPAAVTNLTITGLLMTKMELSWTATGDDGNEGAANGYDLRYALTPITEANWAQAFQVENEPQPQEPGALETMTVGGLQPGVNYYFAIRVADNAGNLSELSNIASASTSQGTIVFQDDMESGKGDWTVSEEDALWHLSNLRANSPSNSWYYGQDDKRNYDTGESNAGFLTSPEIPLAEADEALLVFSEWSQVQENLRFDRTRVQVSTDGNSWKTVFESHGTADKWEQRTISLGDDVDLSGGSLQVRFWFDTVNDRFNEFEGWYVD